MRAWFEIGDGRLTNRDGVKRIGYHSNMFARKSDDAKILCLLSEIEDVVLKYMCPECSD